MALEFDLVVRGGTVVNADGIAEADIGVSDGRIAAIARNVGKGAREVEAQGRLVLPGGVDTHCHIEQVSGNGLLNADTFETATRSAAFGGTTTCVSFAAQHKGQELIPVVEDYERRAQRGALIDYAFHLIVSDPECGSLENDVVTLAERGHRSIKIFTTYNIRLDDSKILQVMAAARAAGDLICVHAENHAIIAYATERNLAAGNTAPKFHATVHSRLAEAEAVARMIRFSEFLDQPVLLFHISTREGVELVRQARQRGSRVRAETCPHYLLMTSEELDRPGLEGAKFMCSPPQRTLDDQEALWQALALGDIQLVTSDHAPFRFDGTGKLANGPDAPFNRIANGMPGLEVRMPLLFDAMVSSGRFDLCKFVEVTACNPARIFGLEAKGGIRVGADADFAIWDPDRKVTFGPDDLHDNVGYNPFEGRTVTGWPETVVSRGDVIVESGVISDGYGRGRRVELNPAV